MTANTEHREIVAFLTNQMSQLTSFSDMFDLYLFNRNILKDWTFIVATTETSNMNLYEGIESISGIRDRMFTPFANGRVSIINDKILKRCLLKNDSRARIFRCVSFDTQTVSYIERYYKKGTVPYEGFETVVQLLKGESMGVDHIPYTIENLMFDLSRKDSVEQTLFAYEMMCGENAGNEKVCRKQARSIVSMYVKEDLRFPLTLKEQYKMIYLSLLKISQIQLEHSKLPLEKKISMFVEFIITKLCRMMQPELNLAKVYFSKGSSCAFFGKIHKGNKNVIEQLKNMTWDLMHLRFMDYSSMMFDAKKGDALIPYFFTYDKRLQDIRECYNLQALAVNPYNYSVIPVYDMADGLFDVLREHCTLEKHMERMKKNPNIDILISECEQDLLKLIQ